MYVPVGIKKDWMPFMSVLADALSLLGSRALSQPALTDFSMSSPPGTKRVFHGLARSTAKHLPKYAFNLKKYRYK